MPRFRFDSLPRLFALLAVGLLAACGGPSIEEDERVCANVECSAGRCVAEAGAPMCRCGAWEEAAGLTCVIVSYQQEDDHGDTPATATALAPSDSFHEGAIQPPFRGKPDRDVFAIPTPAGHGYRFILRAGTLSDVSVVLLESSGRVVSTEPIQREGGVTVEFVSTEEAPRFISLGAARDGDSGTYTYRLEDLGRDAHGDTLATATPLALPSAPFPLAIEFAGDADVFTFRTEANQGFLFSCDGRYVSLSLMDSEGTWVEGVVRAPASSVRAGHLRPEASTWFVRVDSPLKATLTTQCQLEDLGQDDHANEPQGATPLTSGTPVAGRFQGPNDVDVFSFVATTGHLYDLRVLPSRLLPSRARRIRLTGADGRTLAESSEDRVLHEATTTETYFVHVFPDASWELDFEMRMEDLGRDDHGGSPETATRAEVGETVTGVISAETDQDAISVPLHVDGVYRITCTPDCLLSTPLPNRHAVLHQVGPGLWHVLAPTSGLATFIIRWRSSPYAFTFLLEQIGTDDHGDSVADATPQTVPVEATGIFEVARDVDALSFPLVAGQAYVLRSDMSHIGVLDPTLQEVYLEFELTGGRSFTARLSGTYVALLTSARPELNQPVPWTFFLRAR
ncbi:hypothetical protein [Comamonas sp. JC664]|uniref:hypothetical protein n=1 Tax=Comamonas sp. JC664 TaxID=2801917 RepID=UPI00191E6D43|nr:hypothetical protein [Comamonas sp. JC664]MBL0693019.1 hypothetical protein [Comamonas sp. JC664]